MISNEHSFQKGTKLVAMYEDDPYMDLTIGSVYYSRSKTYIGYIEHMNIGSLVPNEIKSTGDVVTCFDVYESFGSGGEIDGRPEPPVSAHLEISFKEPSATVYKVTLQHNNRTYTFNTRNNDSSRQAVVDLLKSCSKGTKMKIKFEPIP